MEDVSTYFTNLLVMRICMKDYITKSRHSSLLAG